MGELPSGRVVLRQAVVAVLIAPSVVGAVALFGVSPGTGLIVGGLTLGAALGVGWSAPRGRLISAISLFVIAALGAFMTFAIGLGWADSAGPFERPPYGALNLPFASFFVALPASIALAIDQALRSDDGRGSPRAVAVADAGARPEGRRRQAILIPVGILAIPLTIGAYVGYGSAYPWTAPGGLEEVGRVLVREPTLALFIALGTGALVVIVARATKGARDGRLVRLALGSAGLVGLGALGGFVLTPVLGVPYVAPVMAFGSASARLDGQPTYTPDVSGYTECESVAGTAVSRVWAEVGSLQLEERQAFLILDNDGPDLFLSRPGSKYARFDVVFFKDHRGYIARPASILEIETSNEGRSGRVVFRLTRGPDEGESHWPAELSGELTWTCGRWLGSSVFQATREGRLDFRLAGVEWVPSGATTSCELEAEGSVRVLSAYGVGLLKGRNVSLHVDLPAEHKAGSEVLASVIVIGADPPGEQLPWWQARVKLLDVTNGDRAGRATFTDMPTAVDPSGAPVSAGWPDTLTGEFTWSCG